MTYKEQVTKIIEKALRDEISTASFYLRQAQEIMGYNTEEVIEKLQEYGKEEFEHYTELLEFAGKFDILKDIKLGYDDYSLEMLETELSKINETVAKLEKTAYNDYKAAARLAMENDDLETHEFFKELMNDEAGHLDDFLLFQNKTRTFGESTIVRELKLRNMLN